MNPLSIARLAGKIEPATEYMTIFQIPSVAPNKNRQIVAAMKLPDVVTAIVVMPIPIIAAYSILFRPMRSAR